MSQSSPNALETRDRILDAAEELFADQGFRNVPLRKITQEAGVNLAAVNYHFGSKDELVREVLTRIINPINARRLELLDAAESECGDDPVPVEGILEAMHRPLVDQLKGSGHDSPVYLKLAGRCLSEPTENFSEAIGEIFKEVVERFIAATAHSLPHLEEEDIFWRMHLSMGAMIQALTGEEKLAMISQGRVQATDPEDTLQRLIEFTAAGLRAERTKPKRKTRSAAKGILAMIVISVLVLSGCKSISPPDAKYLASVKAPAHWIAGPSYRPAHFPDRFWVEDFGEPNLTAFVQSALENNRDLKAAQSRIEIAGSNARIVGADLYPELGGNFGSQRSQQNFIGFPFGNNPPGTILSNRNNNFGLSLDVSWEVDLWGRLRAAKSASVADFEASVFDRATAELSIAGQATKAWIALAESRDQVSLAESTIDTFSETEQFIRERFEGGIDNQGTSLASQLLLSQTDVANAIAILATREEVVGRTARQLEVLAGEYPAGKAGSSARMPGYPGKVPTGLPATLLDRRPDLAASERRIAAADERLLSAKKALLPRIALNGSYGTSSEDIGDILNGDFTIWSIAGNMTQPIFQGGRLRANRDKRGSEVELAAAEFEQTALTAFSEVENALAAEKFYNRRVDALIKATRLSEQAYERSIEEFETGTGDVLTLLAAQERRFRNQSELLNVRRMRLDNRVDLYLSLGGSFRPYEAPLEKEPRT